MSAPLATPDDVTDMWRTLADDAETNRVVNLIRVASGKLRQACPFNIDTRIALFARTPQNPVALDPQVVANVVATIVKRFLVNTEGFASTSEGVGPYSKSGVFVNRYDKTGSDVRGAIQVIEADIDELRPAVPTRIPGVIQLTPTHAMQPPSGWFPGPIQIAPGVWVNDGPPTDPVTGDPLVNLYGQYPDDYTGNLLISTNPSASILATAQRIKGDTSLRARAVTSDTTAAVYDLLLVTTGTPGVTITLPPAVNAGLVVVQKVDTGSGVVTVTYAGTNTTVSLPGQPADFISDGANWYAA